MEQRERCQPTTPSAGKDAEELGWFGPGAFPPGSFTLLAEGPIKQPRPVFVRPHMGRPTAVVEPRRRVTCR